MWWMLPTTFAGRKSKQGTAFWQIFIERCPHKGVLFDEIDTNFGIVNSVSTYLT